MTKIAVIDYGMGNLHSVSKALEEVSSTEEIIVTSDPETIKRADKIVLPGVGAIKDCLDACLLYTSPSPRDRQKSRMPSSA